MGSRFRWTWLAALVLCPLYMDNGILCVSGTVCSEENMAIEGGNYTLSDGLYVDSMLTYHCPEGYYPYPDLTRRCQYNGNWVSPSKQRTRSSSKMKTSVCRVVECPTPVLDDGSISPPQDRYFVNNVTTFECYTGYTLRGSPSRLCQPNGKWNGATPVCGSESGEHCPNPGTPAGAFRVGNDFDIGSKITYKCESQSTTLIGSTERVCLESGQWTGTEPKCYYQHTYDTPQEIAEAFSGSIGQSLKVLADDYKIQAGKRIDVGKDELLNIYIGIDVSASLNKEDFIDAKKSVGKLLRKISSYNVSPNYEIFFFSSEITKITRIIENRNRKKKLSDILTDLDNVDYEALTIHAGTDIAGAFMHIYEQISFLRDEAEAKNNIESFTELSHVIIIFTDGGFNLGGDPKNVVTRIEDKIYMNNATREKYLDIYIFAIGSTIYHDDMRGLATERADEEHYFTISLSRTEGKPLEAYFEDILDEKNSVGLCGLYTESEKFKSRRHPWLAKIKITNERRGNCLGSLVAPKFILTAAHCFRFGDTAKDVQVEIDDGTRTRSKKVKDFKLHPEFNLGLKKDKGVSEYYDFDVALIELEEEVDISVSIRPICIPCTKATSGALKLVGDVTCKQQEEKIFQAQVKEITFMTDDSNIFRRKKAYVQLARRDSCIKHALDAKGITTTNPKDAVSDNFLCTGGHDPQRNHAACKGDSGGSVFVEHEYRTIQVGVVSWGTYDVCPGKTYDKQWSGENNRDFHINLFKVVPFLKEHLGNATADYTHLEFLEN